MPHTGAPWKAQQIGPDYIIQGANHERVFSIRDGVIPMIPDRKLIEAAPDLLEQCQKVLDVIRSGNADLWWARLADREINLSAVIARATGKEAQ
jgi:hypothetical protein